MNLRSEYKDILSKAFKKHFPNWEELSPLDPMKVFEEALACSFADVEKRHARYTETILDSLPSLFSFSPKKAKLPVQLIQFMGRPQSKRTEELASESPLHFQNGDDHYYAINSTPITILPISYFQFQRKDKQLSLTFQSSGPLAQFTFQFCPEQSPLALAPNLRYITLKLIDSATEKEEIFHEESLQIEDKTNSFSSFGDVTLKLRRPEPLHSKEARYEVDLYFEKMVPEGTFYVNTAPCSLCQQKTSVELASLRGEPWEEIPLPADVVVPPAELLLHYPDDRIHKIHRIDTDILKLRHSHGERYQNSFFYNAVNHFLIIPGSSSLVDPYNGGVTALAPTLVLLPPTDTLPSSCEVHLGEYSSILEGIYAIRLLTPASERECNTDYLTRFYSSVRSFQSLHSPTKGVIVEQLTPQLLNLDESIRGIELDVNEETKELTVYILSDNPENGKVVHPSSHQTQLVSEKLSQIVPLDYTWKIERLSRKEISIDIDITVQLDSLRAGTLTEEILRERIANTLAKRLLPPPFGSFKPQTTIRKSALFEDLKTRLQIPLSDHSQLRSSETVSMNGLLLDVSTASYIDSLVRKPGEILVPTLNINTRLSVEDEIAALNNATVDNMEREYEQLSVIKGGTHA